MKRRVIITLCVFLLLGAVVNVAVAWHLITRAQSTGLLGDGQNATCDGMWLFANHDFGWERVWCARWKTGQLNEAVTVAIPHWSDVGDDAAMIHENRQAEYRWNFAGGWPCLSLACMQRFSQTEARLRPSWGTATRFEDFKLGASNEQYLSPQHVIWPGFAINTLFYTTILWLLFAAPGRVRRWRRIRRGLCAKCAYPVGTREVCTECGASVKERSTIPT